MVLEELLTPFQAEAKPVRVIFLGFLYCSIALFLANWVFKEHASMIFVFLTSLAAVPLVYSLIKMEEEKDLTDLEERALLKEHAKALSAFMYLFVGITVAVVFWFVVLPQQHVGILFQSQTETISSINGRVTGSVTAAEQVSIFLHIFLNNLKVLVFCVLFAFVYGFGAIFILAWNASVIGTAIGDFIRIQLGLVSGAVGLPAIASYFQIVSLGLFKYAIHGIPEILSYFIAGLAAGIISVAVIRHEWGSKKFEHILLDSSDLLLLSIFVLFIAGLLEVYVTPLIF